MARLMLEIKKTSKLKHKGIKYSNFKGGQYCPHCNKPVFMQKYWGYSGSDWDVKIKPCPHVIYIWEESSGGSRFWKVRPDFGKRYIQSLINSPKYFKKLSQPQTYALKQNEIASFATGTFKCTSLIGQRVGGFGWDIPSESHSELLPDDMVIYDTDKFSTNVYVGMQRDSRRINIAVTPEMFQLPSFQELK